MDLVNLVVTPVVESLMVPIKKHLGFLFSSTKYVKYTKEKMEQLSLTEQDIQEKKKTADANNHEVSHHVSPWLEDVEKMKEKVQSIPTGGIGCFNVTRRYKVGKQSYTILEQIKALKEQESEIKWTNEQKSLAKVPSTSARVPHGTRSTFESRDLVLNDALQSLQSHDESQKMIALCGMGGVGKTTMMEQLKKVVEDLKMFDWVVKVVIGESTDLIALQSAIAEYIGKVLTETTEDARADRLRTVFEGMSQKGQKKVLVIMDDLWNVFDLKDVGLTPLPDGFKILFTSRFEHICTQIGVRINSIFKVGFLNEAEAKTLFFGIVGPSLLDGDDPELQQTGEKIVKKCGGLPIAIVTIARILSDNIKEAWEKALWRLEKDDLTNLESITHRVFEMSYENLKEDGDKAIFLLSGLFPDDFDIRIEDLLRYAWGLGVLKDDKTLAAARSEVKICINNLTRANLLTESDHAGCVKMHDLVRAFVLNKISEVKQASISITDNKSAHRLTKDEKESYERILLKCTEAFPADFNYPNLSLLILMVGNKFKPLEFQEDIYKRMEKLQVVSYENMHIPSLLLTFEHSNKLRTLCLRSCSFINDDISFLGSLSNLETLSFVDCEISRLPSTIGKLRKLKLLDLTGCGHLRIDDGVFQNLGSLEELYMRAYWNKSIMFTKANCDELETLSHRLFALEVEFFENKAQPKNMSFKNLKRFRISIGCTLNYLVDGKENLFRNTIQFVGDCNELLECKINDLFQKTEELHLQVNEMNHLEDVSMHHSFSNLTVLHVSKCTDLTYLFTVDVATGLKKLEQLRVSECPLMRTLIVENSRVGLIIFNKLKSMSLTSLPKMVSFWDNVIELPKMVKLKLVDLPNFTSIYHDCHNTSEMQSLFNQKVVIPMLRKITMRECDNLVNLFPNNPFPLLNHLEELEVDECGAIEVLFNMEFKSVFEIGEYNTSRLRSIRVENLGKLKELWRMKGVSNSDIHINCFKGVESIMIINCPIFKNIFTPTIANFDLGALTEYCIYYTSEKRNSTLKGYSSDIETDDERMEEVVFKMDGERPLLVPSLKVLQLYGLKETHVWKCNWNIFLHQPSQLPFQNLTNIYLQECHKIKYLFSPLMAKFLSNLKCLSIRQCDGIEEVVSWRDDENEENTFASSNNNTIFFSRLETVSLKNLALLKTVLIYKCDLLSHVFTFSTLESLKQLKKLEVRECKAIQVIVKEENGMSSKDVVFPCLETLKLDGLPSLKGFFLGTNDFRCPILDNVMISDCPQLVMFSHGESKTPKLKYICTWLGKHSLECGLNFHGTVNEFQTTFPSSSSDLTISKQMPWSFHNLIEINIEENKYVETIIPSHAVPQLQKLQKICIVHSGNVKEVFEVVALEGSDFHEAQTVVQIPNLTQVNLEYVPDLKYLWKSNQRMVLEFPNLTTVSIMICHSLEHVFTCSMVASLVQLQDLEISHCYNLKVIVKEEEKECDGQVNEIMLPRLKSLKLFHLPRLEGFCLGKEDFSWPLLDSLQISYCDALKVITKGYLSTPELKVINTRFEKWYVKPDLNSFIKAKQEEGYEF